MPAQLVALTEGPNILLDKPVLLLGRHPECDVQIESRKISRRHCCIAQVEDYLVVRDLGSTNGIRINGVRVLEGRLNSSDELTIGNSRYKVRWDGSEGPSAPANLKGREEAARVGRADAIDDDVLESCEEPVALEDDGDLPRVAPVRKVTEVQGTPSKNPSAPGDSIILPEHLELAPVSEAVPPPARPG